MPQNIYTPLAPSAAAQIIQTSWPPIFGVELLSDLIKQSVPTILSNRSRAPHRLPPACTPPGTRQPLWTLSDVLSWLTNHRETVQEPAIPVPKPTKLNVSVSTRRRPTKVEQAAAEAAGFSSVKAHRSAMKGCAL